MKGGATLYYRYYEIIFTLGDAWKHGADEQVAMPERGTPTIGRKMPCLGAPSKRMMRFHTAASGG